MKFISVLLFVLLSIFVIVSKADKPARCLEEGAVAGRCLAAFQNYYYDQANDECKQFIYGGCGGNGNNFDTKEECEKICKQ